MLNNSVLFTSFGGEIPNLSLRSRNVECGCDVAALQNFSTCRLDGPGHPTGVIDMWPCLDLFYSMRSWLWEYALVLTPRLL
jgi:hypothetical protein